MFGELVLIIAIVSLVYSFYKWATINEKFFERRNVKFMKPIFLFGNTAGFYTNKYTAIEYARRLYDSFPNETIYGMFDFRQPQFIVRDPDAIKRIAIKDFDHFEDHPGFSVMEEENSDNLWVNSLFLMKGEKWRQMRATLSPAFTGSKMRQMFGLVSECANDVVNHFTQKAENGARINIEMKDLFSRYTNDVIATCAFGLKVNSFDDPENEFLVNGRKMIKFTGFVNTIKIIMAMQAPRIARALNLRFPDSKTSNYFKNTILNTMEVRKANNIQRPDMINIMMQVREGNLKYQTDEKFKDEQKGFATVEESDIGKTAVTRKWTDDELVAQCFVFFVAGFDTSATMLTFVSYELLLNPNVQQKLYEEIIETNDKLNGKPINYDTLQKMKYMDQVICETLRKWPPAPQIDRICVKNYVYDDGVEHKFNIDRGTRLFFPIYGIHHDPKYFADPEKFDPERFSDENKDNITPGTYIPFGVGPRNCIGSRFALMQLKAVLYYLLLKFSFEMNEKTEVPVKFVKQPFSLQLVNGMHLELKLRRK